MRERWLSKVTDVNNIRIQHCIGESIWPRRLVFTVFTGESLMLGLSAVSFLLGAPHWIWILWCGSPLQTPAHGGGSGNKSCQTRISACNLDQRWLIMLKCCSMLQWHHKKCQVCSVSSVCSHSCQGLRSKHQQTACAKEMRHEAKTYYALQGRVP